MVRTREPLGTSRGQEAPATCRLQSTPTCPPGAGEGICLGSTSLSEPSGAPFHEGRSRTPGPQGERLLGTQPRAASGRGPGATTHSPAPQTASCSSCSSFRMSPLSPVPSPASWPLQGCLCPPACTQLELRGRGGGLEQVLPPLPCAQGGLPGRGGEPCGDPRLGLSRTCLIVLTEAPRPQRLEASEQRPAQQ